jgi:flagellar protein FlbD
MIELTRLSRERIVVNADLIAIVEAQPDTVLALTTGERVRVLETPTEIVNLVVAYRRRVAGLVVRSREGVVENIHA